MNSDDRKKIKRLLNFVDEINGEEIAINMFKELQLNDEIDKDIRDVVIFFATCGAMTAFSEERYERQKIELDNYRGILDEEAREMDVISRPTEQKIKSWIDRHPEYVKKRRLLLRYKRQYELLKTYTKAFEKKAEMIRTKAATQRLEYNDLGMSGPTVKRKKKKSKEKKHGN